MKLEEGLNLSPGDTVYHVAHPEIPVRVLEPSMPYQNTWLEVEFVVPVGFTGNPHRGLEKKWICSISCLYKTPEEARANHKEDPYSSSNFGEVGMKSYWDLIPFKTEHERRICSLWGKKALRFKDAPDSEIDSHLNDYPAMTPSLRSELKRIIRISNSPFNLINNADLPAIAGIRLIRRMVRRQKAFRFIKTLWETVSLPAYLTVAVAMVAAWFVRIVGLTPAFGWAFVVNLLRPKKYGGVDPLDLLIEYLTEVRDSLQRLKNGEL